MTMIQLLQNLSQECLKPQRPLMYFKESHDFGTKRHKMNDSIKLLKRKIKFEWRNSCPVPVKPSQNISSYMLKNCTLYLLQKMKLDMKEKYSTIFTRQITHNIFAFLVDVADEQQFSPYFRPYSDVFELEKEDDKDRLSYNNCLLILKRKMCLKRVL